MTKLENTNTAAGGSPVDRGVRPDALIALVRTLELDHGPGGWPAVEMATLTALADEVERLIAWIPQAEARQRARIADMLGDMAAVSWAEWDEKADPIDQGRALALEHAAALIEGPNVGVEAPLTALRKDEDGTD
jgi:hypothetical protein